MSSVGLRQAAAFTNFHRVLNRSRWSGRAVARCLLGLLVTAFVPSGPVVVSIDETIKRRWGAEDQGPRHLPRSCALQPRSLRQGIWPALDQPDAARPVPFAGRVWELPFLTVRRWSVEVTFAEVRRHLGVETQRQWSDLAIARTTRCLLALFSLVTLWASDLSARGLIIPRRAAWYAKPGLTFSDAIAAVRRQLWIKAAFSTSRLNRDMV